MASLTELMNLAQHVSAGQATGTPAGRSAAAVGAGFTRAMDPEYQRSIRMLQMAEEQKRIELERDKQNQEIFKRAYMQGAFDLLGKKKQEEDKVNIDRTEASSLEKLTSTARDLADRGAEIVTTPGAPKSLELTRSQKTLPEGPPSAAQPPSDIFSEVEFTDKGFSYKYKDSDKFRQYPVYDRATGKWSTVSGSAKPTSVGTTQMPNEVKALQKITDNVNDWMKNVYLKQPGASGKTMAEIREAYIVEFDKAVAQVEAFLPGLSRIKSEAREQIYSDDEFFGGFLGFGEKRAGPQLLKEQREKSVIDIDAYGKDLKSANSVIKQINALRIDDKAKKARIDEVKRRLKKAHPSKKSDIDKMLR